MFLGEFQHTIDNKGRLIIPVRFREEIGEKFIITKGLDHCLSGYPMEEWERMTDKISKLPSSNPKARQLQRFYFASASPSELDKQGRVNIPQALRDWGNLKKGCVIVGNPKHIEIWDEDCWKAMNVVTEENIGEISIAMEEFGF
ncbi:MAG: division/cell wall cluster transcriptional repressor MraZ [Lactobacillales bacterium]|nr:division/cell wall cluster transcriptional repressor MraZ [Lactobacillales bacterium]